MKKTCEMCIIVLQTLMNFIATKSWQLSTIISDIKYKYKVICEINWFQLRVKNIIWKRNWKINNAIDDEWDKRIKMFLKLSTKTSFAKLINNAF
jgi:hypothetical protein